MLKKKKKAEVGGTKNGEKWWLKIWACRASCIWKTGDSVLLAPPLASGGEPRLFSVALHGWNFPRLTLWGNPVTVQCFSFGFFLFPFFLSSLIWNVSYTTIYLSRTHALLELTGFTGIPSRRAPCKTGLACACAHPLLSEVMDPGLTFWVRYNSGIMTDRRTKYKETKKRVGKMTRRKGVTFYPCLWSGCKFTR